MIRQLAFYIFCFTSCLLTGCSSDSADDVSVLNPEIISPLEGLPDMGNISFESPAIGQRSYFIFFQCLYNPDTKEVSFDYQQDTLVVGITGKESGDWVFQQFLTGGSLSVQEGAVGYWGGLADSVFTDQVSIGPDSITFSKPFNRPSYGFLIQGDRYTIPRVLTTVPEKENATCTPFFGYSAQKWLEYSENYSQFGQQFQYLTLFFDYQEMAYDGPGFMYVYDELSGLVRITWLSYGDLYKANGWDLIPHR